MENSEPNSSASIGPGAQLKAKREAGGHALETVAKDTRITRAKLAALEDDDYARVGSNAFVTGYIRVYAKWLGVDADPLVSAYEQAGKPEQEQYQNFVNQTVEREPGQEATTKRLPLIWLVVALLALWVIATLVFNGDKTTSSPVDSPAEVQQKLPAEETDAPDANAEETETLGAETLESEESAAQEPAEAVDGSAAGDAPAESQPAQSVNPDGAEANPVAETEAPLAASDTLNFSFSGECWVEVHDANDQVLFAQLQQAGDNLQLSGQAPFSVMLGNARVATLTVNGREVNTNPGPNRDTLRLRVGP